MAEHPRRQHADQRPFVTMHPTNVKNGYGPNNDAMCTIAELHFVRRSITKTGPHGVCHVPPACTAKDGENKKYQASNGSASITHQNPQALSEALPVSTCRVIPRQIIFQEVRKTEHEEPGRYKHPP